MTELQHNESVMRDLENRICNYVSNSNPDNLFIVRKYHMDEVRSISKLMLKALHGLDSAYALNSSFHMALTYLNLNMSDLLVPCKIEQPKETGVRFSLN